MNTQDLLFSLCNGINAAAAFLFGLFVLTQDLKSKLHQLWFCMSLAVTIWGGFHFFFFMPLELTPQARILLVRSANAGAVFIPVFYLHFIVTFLHLTTKRLLLLFCYFATFLIAGSAWGPLFIPAFKSSMGLTHYPIGGPSFLAFFLLYIFESAYASLLLWNARRITRGPRRTQITYILTACVFGFLAGGTAFLPCFDVPFHPIGMCFVWLYCFFLTWAVFRHQLFDIRIVIRKSLIYSTLVSLLTVGYFGFIYGAEKIFQTTFGYRSIWISISAFALMAFLFQPLKIGIQRLVDWLLFRTPHEELVRRMERLEREAQQTERLRAVATLAAGLCHELRNPLQAIQTHAEFIPERYDDPGFRERCSEVMRTEIGRINDLLRQLMEFAKPKPPAFRAVCPHEILDSTLNLLSNDFLRRRIHLEKRYEANGSCVQADSDQLRQVILNLLLNALQAIPEGGRITVATRGENGWYTLEVSDNGPGIDPRILPKLFEPFNTTKPDGNGLGLSIVHSIIREHRGRIHVHSDPGCGATFTIQFPMA